MSPIEIKRNPPSLRERTVIQLAAAIAPASYALDRVAAAVRALPLGTFYDEEPLLEVRPPEGTLLDTYHWLTRGGGGGCIHTVGRWGCGLSGACWWLISCGTGVSPERMHDLGYAYHSPLPPPDGKKPPAPSAL